MGQSVDVQLGRKIRHGRWMLGLPQDRLAEKIGVPAPEIQQYEAGTHPVSASRLKQIAVALGMPVTFFFDGLENRGAEAGDPGSGGISREEALALVRNYMMSRYCTMSEPERRNHRHLGDFAEAITDQGSGPTEGVA